MSIQKLFKKEKPIRLHNPLVPSGLIAKTDKGYFYIKGVKKFKFVSDRAMLSWNLPIISTTDDKLAKLSLAGTLGFRDGTLIKDISDGKIYLISDSKRRHIVEPDVLEWLNTDIVEAGQKEVLVHIEGDTLGS